MWKLHNNNIWIRQISRPAQSRLKTNNLAFFSPRNNIFGTITDFLTVWYSEKTPLFLNLAAKSGWNIVFIDYTQDVENYKSLCDQKISELDFDPLVLLTTDENTFYSSQTLFELAIQILNLDKYGPWSYYSGDTNVASPVPVKLIEDVLPQQPEVKLESGVELILMISPETPNLEAYLNRISQFHSIKVIDFNKNPIKTPDLVKLIQESKSNSSSKPSKLILLGLGQTVSERKIISDIATKMKIPYKILWAACFVDICRDYYSQFEPFDPTQESVKFTRII